MKLKKYYKKITYIGRNITGVGVGLIERDKPPNLLPLRAPGEVEYQDRGQQHSQ